MTVAESELAGFLLESGFSAVPLQTNVAGQLQTEAAANGESLLLLLDTGASHTVLHRDAAERLGLIVGEAGFTAAGLGSTNHAVTQSLVERLRLGEMDLGQVLVVVTDLGHVNQTLGTAGGQPIDGVIGGDILRRGHAVIDFAGRTLYLRPEPA